MSTKKLQILDYLSQKIQLKFPDDHLLWESSEITTSGSLQRDGGEKPSSVIIVFKMQIPRIISSWCWWEGQLGGPLFPHHGSFPVLCLRWYSVFRVNLIWVRWGPLAVIHHNTFLTWAGHDQTTAWSCKIQHVVMFKIYFIETIRKMHCFKQVNRRLQLWSWSLAVLGSHDSW